MPLTSTSPGVCWSRSRSSAVWAHADSDATKSRTAKNAVLMTTPPFRRGSLVEGRDVVRQVQDVLVAERPGDAGHAARVVGARARLESLQFLDDVLRMLARDARDLVLPGESS